MCVTKVLHNSSYTHKKFIGNPEGFWSGSCWSISKAFLEPCLCKQFWALVLTLQFMYLFLRHSV
jgi:hypothetical protein